MSTAVFNTWQNSDGTVNYKCRAWVNFNGTGTVAIRASGNVSSITDNGTGNYTVNFTTAMPDANYAVNGTCGSNSTTTANDGETLMTYALTTTAVSAITGNADVAEDQAFVHVTIFR
jgi:hypothetical protein